MLDCRHYEGRGGICLFFSLSLAMCTDWLFDKQLLEERWSPMYSDAGMVLRTKDANSGLSSASLDYFTSSKTTPVSLSSTVKSYN